jgi:hypothetical protein
VKALVVVLDISTSCCENTDLKIEKFCNKTAANEGQRQSQEHFGAVASEVRQQDEQVHQLQWYLEHWEGLHGEVEELAQVGGQHNSLAHQVFKKVEHGRGHHCGHRRDRQPHGRRRYLGRKYEYTQWKQQTASKNATFMASLASKCLRHAERGQDLEHSKLSVREH